MINRLNGQLVIGFDDPKEFEDLLRNSKVGIYNLGPGIGDHVYHTYFPEVYYKNTKKKVIDVKHHWCYDFNPYVEREGDPDVLICPWCINDRIKKNTHLSPVEVIFKGTSFNTFLRHPRLYRFEDSEKIPNGICVHTTGVSSKFSFPDSVIDVIQQKYGKDFQIFQVGAKTDKPTPFIDRRGLPSIWDTVELISKCQMFIGVNSGLYHIANCYPTVWKKIVLADTLHSLDSLKAWTPLDTSMKDGVWSDIATTYYNLSEVDLGITYSYKKL